MGPNALTEKYTRCNIVHGHRLHRHKTAQIKTIHSPQFTRSNGCGLNWVNPSYCSRYLWYAQRTEKRGTHTGSIQRFVLVERLMGITTVWGDEGSPVSRPIGILCWAIEQVWYEVNCGSKSNWSWYQNHGSGTILERRGSLVISIKEESSGGLPHQICRNKNTQVLIYNTCYLETSTRHLTKDTIRHFALIMFSSQDRDIISSDYGV